MTPAPILTLEDLVRAAADDRYTGWGYLGEARNARDAVHLGEFPDAVLTLVEALDRRVIDLANAAGLAYDQLLAWCDSQTGRHFADTVIGGRATARFDELVERAVQDGYGPGGRG